MISRLQRKSSQLQLKSCLAAISCHRSVISKELVYSSGSPFRPMVFDRGRLSDPRLDLNRGSELDYLPSPLEVSGSLQSELA